MKVLICKNISSEGPGILAGFLTAKGIPYQAVDLYAGETLPELSQFDAAVLLGGPMSVNDALPWYGAECELIRQFHAERKKLLGICLGAQMIARALGKRVYRNGHQEIGWFEMERTEAGSEDLVFRHLCPGPRAKVFHWHEETFELPPEAVHLSRSELFENQAFRIGTHIYGVQFHPEVNARIVSEWCQGESMAPSILAETARHIEDYNARARAFFEQLLCR